MGLLDALLGNASEIDPAKLQAEFARVLAPNERIEKAYQLLRDLFVSTDKRLNVYELQSVLAAYVAR